MIYSMTTSTHADAPRVMHFLYELNRLNVATSRAKALSILVWSPALFEPECRTPDADGQCVLQVFGIGGAGVKSEYGTQVPHWAHEGRTLWWN